MPLPRILPADEVCLEVCYIESLTFDNSFYNFSIPLEFLPGMLPIDYNLNSLISINIASYSFSQETSFESSSHSLQLVKKQKNAVIITATPQGNTACNFNLRYRFLAEGITSTLIHQAAGSNQFDNRGSFVLFVTPPTANTANKFFNRNIIFLLDRSGSMTGEPFAEATKALIIAIESLQPGDKFSIVAFDHDQRIFSDSVLEASERQFDRARKWIELQAPVGGGTDIQTPLTWALQVLNSQVDKASQHLSCVVLITDGCVSEERNIVNRISKSIGESRIYTLGIGSYCNWFFLKILAQVGRGFDEVVVYREQICSQVQFLLKRASQAVLRDISLSISQITDCELYP